MEFEEAAEAEEASVARVGALGGAASLLTLGEPAAGGEAAQHWTHWGEHYATYERDLTRTELAPWVLKYKGVTSGTASVRLMN